MTNLHFPPRRAPFRADHVGSLLRPQIIQQAHYFNSPAAELRAAEDEAIARLVKLQKRSRIRVFTDGNARRALSHCDFMTKLNGLDMKPAPRALDINSGYKAAAISPHLTGPLGFPADHPMLEHFRFLNDLVKPADGVAKISIPAPSAVHFRSLPEHIEYGPYLDQGLMFHDIAQTYKDAVQAFYDAGCRYLQFDDVVLAHLGDPNQRALRRAIGQDPDKLVEHYAWMLEEAIKDRPADMVIALHICRGNFRSDHMAAGGNDLAMDAIFNRTSVDVYFIGYDSDHAGRLGLLGLLPKGHKRVMAGFITTKTGALESLDDLHRKVDAAARFCDLDQLGIAPHCGFSSAEHRSAITEDDQKRKLRLLVDTAQKIWGES